MTRRFTAGLLLFALAGVFAPLSAQDFGFDAPASANDRGAASLMRDLAERVVPVYQEADPDLYLSNMAALQLVTANYTAAYDTAQTLRDRHPGIDATRTVDRAVLYEIYARARAIEATEKLPFAQAFPRAYREVMPTLNGADAEAVMARMATPLSTYAEPVQQSLDRYRKAEAIPLFDALELLRRYSAFEAHRSFAPLVAALNAEEQKRRYIAAVDAQVRTPSGAVIHLVVVRPPSSQPLTTLLRFTDDPQQDDARLTAAHGYVGVVAYVRGRGSDGRGAVQPFMHDGADARAVIDWIAKQIWSDGRVGLYGEGYSGFAAWAAISPRAPKALKAIATISPWAPGIDFPMEGQIVRNHALRWAQKQAAAKPPLVDAEADAAWARREADWYRSGRDYWSLDRMLLKHVSPLFRSWLTHPSDDRWWKHRRPAAAALAKLDLPVLTIAGTDGSEPGALFDFDQHLAANPKADHRLLVGPWDYGMLRDGDATRARGMALDVAARIDPRELRYQWFDHVLRQKPLPEVMADRVNVFISGSNQWRHAASFGALSAKPLRLSLGTGNPLQPALLDQQTAAGEAYLETSIDLGQRRGVQQPAAPSSSPEPAAAAPSNPLVTQTLPFGAGVAFTGAPLAQPLDLAGRLHGQLDIVPNRQDADLTIALYEQRANGEAVPLGTPYSVRASYAANRTDRRLLRAGERQTLDFTLERLIGRRIAAGSRLVLVVGVAKRADRQTNYGSGKAVNQESAQKDDEPPLRLRWYGGFVEVPVSP